MRALLALAAVLTLLAASAPVSASAGGPSACMGCDAIIALCQKYLGYSCVESAGPHADARCAISLCQTIDRVCARFGAHCLA
jgi:hypothetical protein